MDLTFKKSSQLFGEEYGYEAELQVTSDFNLHIERAAGGRFIVYQRGVAEGKYDLVEGIGFQDQKRVIDLDFAALVYPKWIKVVSESEVVKGTVTFNA